MKRSHALRPGFSFLELLVVIAIIAALLSMLLPAVSIAREAARRSNCSRNLAQLVLAIQNYQNLHGVYPPGTIDDQGPVRSIPQGYHHNWIVQILPFLEERNAWRHVDPNVSVYHPRNAPVARLTLRVLQCPSQSPTPRGQSCYAAAHHGQEAPIDVDNHGVFFLNSRVRYEDVSDGTSHTIFLGEILADAKGLGWMSGTRATLRNTGGSAGQMGAAGLGNGQNGPAGGNGPAERQSQKRDPALEVGTFGGVHGGGSLYAFGDGRVRFLSTTASPAVLMLLGRRADGRLLDGEAY